MNTWKDCKKILVIRADNMGDLLMSSPAIRTVKQYLNCSITVLTSSKASAVARLMPEIDDIIEFNVPWMKLQEQGDGDRTRELIHTIKQHNFDGCIVFNVYSQNPLPAIMLAYLADIPLRLAYCRENPYGLLSNWVPDPEPFDCIKHQVERDLDLVAAIGGFPDHKRMVLKSDPRYIMTVTEKISSLGDLEIDEPYFILHPGVSELKRRYPKELWIETGKLLSAIFGYPIFLTGTADEQFFTADLATAIGENCYSVAGLFSVGELAVLIQKAEALISVNTGTVHLAVAVQTPMVVLYAQTNPQHTPWMVNHELLEFSIPGNIESENKVIRWVNRKLYREYKPYPRANDVVFALKNVLKSEKQGC